MRKYLAVMKITFKDFAAYRSQIYITYVGWITRLMIIVFLWKAIFAAKSQIGNYNFPEILTYFILVQIAMSFVFSHIGFHYARDINNGDLSNFLHRPISYPLFKFIYEISMNFARTMIGLTIYALIIVIFYRYFSFHLSFASIPLAIISLVFGFIINYSMVAMIGMLTFWFSDSSRLVYIYFSIVTIFSGLTIPVDLFPQKMFEALKYTPFPYSFFLPVKILQNTDINGNIPLLRMQIFFAILLSLAAMFMYKKGLKKYEASGK